MDNEKEVTQQEDNSLVYVVGAIIVIAVVVAGILLWPKPAKQTVAPAATEQTVESKPMLTKLICEKQWYNPVIGKPNFYLSAIGGDIDPSTKVECTFTLANATNEVIKTEKVPVALTPAADRGGSTFSCTTKALDGLPMNVPLKMTTMVTNDQDQTASCTGTVILKQQ